jgi:hypothetical protein
VQDRDPLYVLTFVVIFLVPLVVVGLLFVNLAAAILCGPILVIALVVLTRVWRRRLRDQQSGSGYEVFSSARTAFGIGMVVILIAFGLLLWVLSTTSR